MKIDAQNYPEMWAWLKLMVPLVFRKELLTPETDPVARLAELESRSPSKAQAGLAMAIGDIIEMVEAWPIEQVTAADLALHANGLPSLSVARVLFSKSIRLIVRRGKIENDTEYCLVRSAVEVARGGDDALWSLLAAYDRQ